MTAAASTTETRAVPTAAPPLLEPGAPEAVARRRRPAGALVVVSLAVGLVFAAPTAYIAWRNLTLGSDVVAVLFSWETLETLWNTVVLAVSVAAATTVIGTGLAWVTTRTDVALRGLWRVLAPLPLVFPSFVGAAALVTAFAPGGLVEGLIAPLGVDTLPTIEGFRGAWLVLTLFTYPFVYLPVAARLRGLPPSLEESARLLGRGSWDTFRTVVLPQTSGAVWAGALLVFLYTLSDFGVVQLMRYDTLTREIFENRLFDQAKAFALALILAVLALLVVTAERAVNRRRLQVEAVRAREPLQIQLGRWRWPVFALVSAFLANALLSPIAALGFWVWRGLANADDAAGALVTDLEGLVEPTLNTAVVSVVSAVVAVAIVLPVAYLTTRYRSRAGGVSNAFVVGGFALPGLAIALAVVFWALNTPGVGWLYQTLPLLIFAYVVHFGAQSMRASQVAVGGVPRRLDDAARTLGAGRVRRIATVDVPLMYPGLLAGAGLVMLSVMKELPATLLLRPTWFDTLSTRIWNALEDGFWAEVGLTSLVLVAVSGILTWLLVVRRADRFD